MLGGIVNNLWIVKSAPARYINKEGIIKEVGEYVLEWGNTVLVSSGNKALQSVEKELFYGLDRNNIKWSLNKFQGECSESNILKLIEMTENLKPNAIIGIGGGKSLDTAKVAAAECRIPIICIPTIAATCAATTPISVIYDEEGVYQRDYYCKTNPDLVLVDPSVIAKAPIEYLYAGLLDALAKWYEGSASITGTKDVDIFDHIALATAEILYKRLLEKGEDAVYSVKNNQVTEALIDVINLNVYVAGMIQSLGVKAVRNGIAHAVHNGLTMLKESHSLLHGIKVGYGIAVQLVLLNKSEKEINEVLSFFKKIGFEPSFKNLGLPFNESALLKVAQKVVSDPLTKREPFDHITIDLIISAMKRLEERYIK